MSQQHDVVLAAYGIKKTGVHFWKTANISFWQQQLHCVVYCWQYMLL